MKTLEKPEMATQAVKEAEGKKNIREEVWEASSSSMPEGGPKERSEEGEQNVDKIKRATAWAGPGRREACG